MSVSYYSRFSFYSCDHQSILRTIRSHDVEINPSKQLGLGTVIYCIPPTIEDQNFVDIMIRAITENKIKLGYHYTRARLNRLCPEMAWSCEIRGSCLYIVCHERSASLTTWFRMRYSSV